ncbi:UBX domain-containing protein 1-B [Lepeophtheirus salmonis]|uniref:UBX domaincontaining protein 1like [Ciona intestinalis] n=1 Tax=Lepeophtheirus salmonis TaxID=72036 RepID=A0A0K2V0R9_LEPSM|nr:UBX domain-containing protein 1-A-like [Lepeophtheirus salmonis]
MSTVADVLQTLTDMGFSEGKAKLALTETSWKGVEAAMEWLLAHADDPEPSGVADKSEEGSEENPESKEGTPSESKPIILTEEEKKAKLRRLEELRVLKRKEREEAEKSSEVEKEKKRISEGKMLSSIRKNQDDLEMKKIAEERRREKLETQRAKERVRGQIEEDKRARREAEEKRRNPNAPRISSIPPPSIKPVAASSSEPNPKYTQSRIQIRLPNGSTLVQTFSVKESLSSVRLYTNMNRSDPEFNGSACQFMTSFPRKVFTQEEYEKTLESLELVPSAVLIVKK